MPGHHPAVILSNPNILGGTPVFRGTRVPVKTLIDHLEAGDPLDKFLDHFPTVSREQAVAVLELAKGRPWVGWVRETHPRRSRKRRVSPEGTQHP